MSELTGLGYQLRDLSFFAASDEADSRFTCDICWSRPYEYQWAIRVIQRRRLVGPRIHNTSWGHQGIHLVFKTWLDVLYEHTIHSDLIPSTLHGCNQWNITTPPPTAWLDRFDVVLSISTLEEVAGDHVAIIRDRLLPQLRRGGLLAVTFDVPGFQLDKIEAWLGDSISTPPDPLTPRSSRWPDHTLKLPDRYMVGRLLIERTG